MNPNDNPKKKRRKTYMSDLESAFTSKFRTIKYRYFKKDAISISNTVFNTPNLYLASWTLQKICGTPPVVPRYPYPIR